MEAKTLLGKRLCIVFSNELWNIKILRSKLGQILDFCGQIIW
jgi:hypothetical protein